MQDKYGYTLNTGARGREKQLYYRSDLELMTTHQLREICRKEKIIHGIIAPMDKEDLIRTVLRYRGADECLLIKKHNSDGRERLEVMLQSVNLHYDKDIQPAVTAKIVVYEDRSVGYFDEVRVQYHPKLEGTNVLLISGENKLCGIFNIEARKGNKDYLYLTKAAEIICEEASNKNYTLLCMSKRSSELVYNLYQGKQEIFPDHLAVYRVQLLDFIVRKPVELPMPLAVDFGSSNTTAAVYLDSFFFERLRLLPEQLSLKENEVNYMTFYDVLHDDEETALLPSVVGVLAVEDENLEYLYGYEALKLMESSYLDEGICVFYDIKRWIADYEKNEEIIDRRGQRAFAKRRDIIRAFFLNLVKLVESRFKCVVKTVHISCPVKQKYLFKSLFTRILPEYISEKDEVIDEGVAVLYNTISEMVHNGSVEEDELYKALIIDCGGGTIDLTSCNFSVYNDRVSYKVSIENTYENGDADFGGNNLTYRIMQLLKVKIHQALYNKDKAKQVIDDLLHKFDVDIFRYVDTSGKEKLYELLDNYYVAAEKNVPTKFHELQNLSRVDYYKIKNNFYFLFHIAEQIKKEFYNKIGTLRVKVSSADTVETSDSLTILGVDKWKLTLQEDKKLSTVKDLPDVYFTFFEIDVLCKADIYAVIHRFINKMYENQYLEEYSLIKLTGQSCKVNAFRDSLNEFVAGKTIQLKRKSGDLSADFELKMACVDGASKLLCDRKYGFADIAVKTKMPQMPYVITGYTHSGEEIVLIHGLKKSCHRGHISRNMDELTLKLYLEDMHGKKRYNYTYNCTLDQFSSVQYEDIEALHGENIPQDDTDTIVDHEMKFFVWTDTARWGFVVTPVYRQDELLMLGRAQFFNFENDSWVENFFDGTK